MELDEEILFHYRRLESLLRQDRADIPHSMGGELQQSYQELIDRELNKLQNAVTAFRNSSIL